MILEISLNAGASIVIIFKLIETYKQEILVHLESTW